MAALTEVSQWEDEIYRIEENDPVQGGESGVDNKPHKDLANRTNWLKQELESEATTRTNADTALANSIASEATTRTNADTALANSIASEATSRANADTALANSIATEATTRTNADTALANAIAAEATSRTNADTALANSIAAEATNRANAFSDLASSKLIPSVWISFNGSDGSIRGSYGLVDSVIKRGTGIYTLNLGLVNANYSVIGSAKPSASDTIVVQPKRGGAYSAVELDIECWVNTATPTLESPAIVNVHIFGGLS